ncbi:hypothetical protein MRX96_010078 [Rhipicephalus microplus]
MGGRTTGLHESREVGAHAIGPALSGARESSLSANASHSAKYTAGRLTTAGKTNNRGHRAEQRCATKANWRAQSCASIDRPRSQSFRKRRGEPLNAAAPNWNDLERPEYKHILPFF